MGLSNPDRHLLCVCACKQLLSGYCMCANICAFSARLWSCPTVASYNSNVRPPADGLWKRSRRPRAQPAHEQHVGRLTRLLLCFSSWFAALTFHKNVIWSSSRSKRPQCAEANGAPTIIISRYTFTTLLEKVSESNHWLKLLWQRFHLRQALPEAADWSFGAGGAAAAAAQKDTAETWGLSALYCSAALGLLR